MKIRQSVEGDILYVSPRNQWIVVRLSPRKSNYAEVVLEREEAIEWADAILTAVRDMDDARKEREGATTGADAATPDV